MENQLIKKIVEEFDGRVSALILYPEQERDLLAAVVDEQVKKEFPIEMVGGKPIGDVSARL